MQDTNSQVYYRWLFDSGLRFNHEFHDAMEMMRGFCFYACN